MDEIKSARTKPLYEEVKYNRAVDDRNLIKSNYDLSMKALRDSKSDLNSANILMKKSQNELAVLNKRIENMKKQKGKNQELQKLYTEKSAIESSAYKVSSVYLQSTVLFIFQCKCPILGPSAYSRIASVYKAVQ
jgi:hypothetical protein